MGPKLNKLKLNKRELISGSAAFVAASVMGDGTAMSDSHSKISVPAEEARHDRTFMQWPASHRVHPEKDFLTLLQKTIARIANTIAEYEPVVLLAAQRHHDQIRRLVSSKVALWNIPTEDLWCRDSGPLFAIDTNGSLVVSHIRFNGWGGKQVHKHDSRIATAVAEHLGIPVIDSGLAGEAGGIEHDGHGLLMAHESSWVIGNRNPGLTRSEIDKRLRSAYGADRVIWSKGVKGQDITDYHIDSLARFTAPGRVLMNLPDEPDRHDPFHIAALDTHDRLVAEGLDVDVIPEPLNPRIGTQDFVASYVNYYVCNGAVIAAEFGDEETDAIARKSLQKHYPDREIVTLNVDALGEVGGGIHCATQQMPAV